MTGLGTGKKRRGGMTLWEVDGRDVSFASGYYLRLEGWGSEKFAWDETELPDHATQSDDVPPEIDVGFSGVYGTPLNVDVRYQLYDYNRPPDAIPALLGAVVETITITNTSGNAVNFDWFVYHDFDVGDERDRSISATEQGGIDQHFNHSDRPRRTKVVTGLLLVHQDGTQRANFDGMAFGIFGGKIDGPPTILNELIDNSPTTFDPPPAATIRDYSGVDFIHGVQFHFENVKNSVTIRIFHQVYSEDIFTPDFVLSANKGHSVNVHFEWEIPGLFYPPIAVGEDLGVNYGSFAVADFTGDGKLDFIAATDENPPQLYLFTRTSAVNFAQTHIATLSGDGAPDYGLGLVAADLDNDGDIDFLENLRYMYPNGSWFGKGNAWINNGSGAFSRVADAYDFTSLYLGWTLGITSTLGDLNSDGYPDLLASAQATGGDTSSPVYMLPGSASGTFGPPQLAFQSAFVAATFISIGEFDNDGRADALVGGDDDGDPGASYLYIGHGDGSFSATGEAIDTNPGDESGYDQKGWGGLRAYDVDHDGILDVLAGSALHGPNDPDTSSNLVWFKGLGGGSFDPGPGGAGITIVAWPFATPLPHPTAFSAPVSLVPIHGDINGNRCVYREDL